MQSIERAAREPISLERPIGDDSDTEFGQLIADDRAESPYELAVEAMGKTALDEVLARLTYASAA